MNTLNKLKSYMAGRRKLYPIALILSVTSSLLGILPYLFVWFIVRLLIGADGMVNQSNIMTYAWWAFGTAVGGVVLYFVALAFSHLVAFRVETNMRRYAMKKLVSLPLGFYDNNTSGKIRKVIDDNASITHSFLAHQMPDLAATLLLPVLSVVLIIVVDWRLGLACLVPVVSAMTIMGGMMMGKGRKFMAQYMTSLEEMNTEAVEYVRGIPVVKVFQQTVFSFKQFHGSIKKYHEMVSRYSKLWEKPMATYTMLIHGFAFVLIPVAILIMGNSAPNELIMLNLFFFILITPVFGQCIMRSMYLSQALGQAKEAVSRIEDLTDAASFKSEESSLRQENHDIEFKNVVFQYPGAKKNAIDGVSFRIPSGKTYALVGPSGGGKTTIARLIPRFWDIIQGEICIGGVNVKSFDKKELMKQISFVFQSTKLFKMSLLENIRYGASDASLEQVNKAVDLAQCREVIEKLPNGLNTKLGAEGTYLSGGEQQRIALARAILKNAPIVLLDEATAFADPENEHLIQQAMGSLTQGKTVLMIAHRLSSIRHVDQILVVKDGKIVEQGTHNQLVNQHGIYTNMWEEYQRSAKWTIGKEEQYV
ncbi:ABC transporter ATP-binding protein [Prolixibacteraceae bacterium JC049]|nr:ABC transporter ATP-binding protein [Prolixibacteraceae bacterium JC049]